MCSGVARVEGSQEGATEWRQWEWQYTFSVLEANQSIWWLWLLSNRTPNKNWEWGKRITKKIRVSLWLPDRSRVRGAVRWVTWASNLLSSAKTLLGDERDSVGMLAWETKSESIKVLSALSQSAPEVGVCWGHYRVSLSWNARGRRRGCSWSAHQHPPVVW